MKLYIRVCLYLYHGKIETSGLSNVPKDKPVVFLPNHQNALIDVLLIAVDCNRKPYFLTRSDVFRNKTLNMIFDFFGMIPIYRIRDGRESLKNNQAVFDQCAELLKKKEALVLFPEGNHNLKRRIRPLSKGFTRILFNTLEQHRDLDVRLVPVGLNYKNAECFPDSVAIHYGNKIAVQDLYEVEDLKSTTERIKEAVSSELKTLTTHIEDEERYTEIVQYLDALNVNYLNPKDVNDAIKNMGIQDIKTRGISKKKMVSRLLKGVFIVLNFPVILLWRAVFKSKVWETEFMGTLRFAYSLIIYPIFYVLLFIAIASFWNIPMGLIIVMVLFLFNWMYVKLV